ncbi:MAG: class I SAM-dependent methyltransferase [Saprospiraceae bacterium]|nr:class I SAM-dependent methyltransferase [Saprospiraceae bacterium]
MEILQSILRFWQYYRKALTIYDVHSPYASAMINSFFDRSDQLPVYVRKLRQKLYRDHALFEIADHGAGSRIRMQKRTISQTARTSLSRPAQLIRLYQLCRFSNPKSILELGTSFGLSGIALQAAAPQAKVYTIEGDPTIADLASTHFQEAGLQRTPETIQGTFAKRLPELLARIGEVDFVFIDGDHTHSATLSNLMMILPSLHNDSLVVIHDIYWSRDMMAAWEDCKSLEAVRMSLDFFDMGVLIFRKEISVKQHFSVIPYWLKPWRIGLFSKDHHQVR